MEWMPPLGAFCYPAGLFEYSPFHNTPAAGSRRRHNSPGQRKSYPRQSAAGGCHNYRDWRYPRPLSKQGGPCRWHLRMRAFWSDWALNHAARGRAGFLGDLWRRGDVAVLHSPRMHANW
jgi:hypothetical protein